jgi:endonuclease/exonuclease/phosphatase family metal-dependent hydrolase
MQLISWNVRYFGHGLRGLRATDRWMQRIVATLAARDPLPHVLALQEVEDRSLRVGLRGHQLQRFVAKLRQATGHTWHGHHWSAHRYGASMPFYGQGQAIVWRDGVELVAADRFDITHVRLPAFRRLKQRRIAVHARLRFEGRPLDLVQVHLSLPAFFERGDPPPGTRRMGHGSNQIREMEQTLDWLVGRLTDDGEWVPPGQPPDADGPPLDEGVPAVIVGDLNSQPGTAVTDRLEAAGWSDAFREGARLSLEEQRALGTHAFLGTPMHIDHLYTRGRIGFVPTEVHALGQGPFAGLSDHTPKEGRLVW